MCFHSFVFHVDGLFWELSRVVCKAISIACIWSLFSFIEQHVQACFSNQDQYKVYMMVCPPHGIKLSENLKIIGQFENTLIAFSKSFSEIFDLYSSNSFQMNLPLLDLVHRSQTMNFHCFTSTTGWFLSTSYCCSVECILPVQVQDYVLLLKDLVASQDRVGLSLLSCFSNWFIMRMGYALCWDGSDQCLAQTPFTSTSLCGVV